MPNAAARPPRGTHANSRASQTAPVNRSVGVRVDRGLTRAGQVAANNPIYRSFDNLNGPVRKLVAGSAAVAGAGTIAAGGPNPLNWPQGAVDAAQWVADHRQEIGYVSGTMMMLAMMPKAPSAALRVKVAGVGARAAQKTAGGLSTSNSALRKAVNNRTAPLVEAAEATPTLAKGSLAARRANLAARPMGAAMSKLGKPAASVGTGLAAWGAWDSAQAIRKGDGSARAWTVFGLNTLGALTGAAYLRSLQHTARSSNATHRATDELGSAENTLKARTNAPTTDDEPVTRAASLRHLVDEAKVAPGAPVAKAKANAARGEIRTLAQRVPDEAKPALNRAASATDDVVNESSLATRWDGMTDVMWHSGVYGNLAFSAQSLLGGGKFSRHDGYAAADMIGKLGLSLHGRGAPSAAPVAR